MATWKILREQAVYVDKWHVWHARGLERKTAKQAGACRARHTTLLSAYRTIPYQLRSWCASANIILKVRAEIEPIHEAATRELRCDIMRVVHACRSSSLGSSLSALARCIRRSSPEVIIAQFRRIALYYPINLFTPVCTTSVASL